MKHFLPATLLVLLHFSLAAQISLTSADMPAPGAVIITDYVLSDSLPNVNEGNAGANQTWNFTNAKTSSFPYPTYYIKPAQAPSPNAFSGADLVSTDELSDSAAYTYHKSTSAVFSTLGSIEGADKLTYAQPLKTFDLPVTYQGTFNQNTAVSGTFEGLAVNGTAKNFMLVDGYGSVTTGLGTFPCLRVKRISELKLTIVFFDLIQRDTIYEYWTKSYDAPVFSVFHSYSSFGGDEAYYKDATALAQQTTAVEDPLAPNAPKIELYPNPTNGTSNLYFRLTKQGKTEVTVLDMNGKVVRQESLGNLTPGEYNQTVDLNGVTNGIYVVALRQEGKLFGVRQLVKN